MVKNIIIACSSQKEKSSLSRPIWHPGITVSEWKSTITQEKGIFSPEKLYIGQHFLQQKKIIQKNFDNIWIVSAGLGLLSGTQNTEDKVNHYDAAFSKKFGSSTDYWSELPFGGLRRLLSVEGEIIIALPIPYQKAIISDPNFPKVSNRMIALGPGPIQKQKNVKKTPYHPRMIDVYGGQRLGLFTYLLKSYYEDPLNFTGLSKVKREAEKLSSPPKRKKINSDEELNLIISQLPSKITSGAKAVRFIRDQLNRSCSQERILSAWKKSRK